MRGWRPQAENRNVEPGNVVVRSAGQESSVVRASATGAVRLRDCVCERPEPRIAVLRYSIRSLCMFPSLI